LIGLILWIFANQVAEKLQEFEYKVISNFDTLTPGSKWEESTENAILDASNNGLS